MRRLLLLAANLLAASLLSACGGPKPSTTDDPTAQNVAAAAAAGTPAALTAAADCSNRPDFVPVYAGATIVTCISDRDGIPRHVSGTIVYQVKAAPREVLGWSRGQANASGLRQSAASATMYSAGEEAHRSVIILVEPMNGGTRATVNWGGPI